MLDANGLGWGGRILERVFFKVSSPNYPLIGIIPIYILPQLFRSGPYLEEFHGFQFC
jgi:hypothetical protein